MYYLQDTSGLYVKAVYQGQVIFTSAKDDATELRNMGSATHLVASLNVKHDLELQVVGGEV